MSIDILNCKSCKNYLTKNCNCELKFDKYGSVFDHTINVLKNLPEYSSFELQIAALFHDVGKTNEIKENIEGKMRFADHEKNGYKMSKKIFHDLKLDKKTSEYISHLIKYHMKIHTMRNSSDKTIKKFIRECEEYIDDLFILVNADCHGTITLNELTHKLNKTPDHRDIKNRIDNIKLKMNKENIKQFYYFDGNEIMKIFNIDKPCKLIGEIKQIQLDIIDEYGKNLSKEEVIDLIKKKINQIKIK